MTSSPSGTTALSPPAHEIGKLFGSRSWTLASEPCISSPHLNARSRSPERPASSAWARRGPRPKTAAVAKPLLVHKTGGPHGRYRTALHGGCHLRRPAGPDLVRPATSARRTLRRLTRPRPATQDLGPTGGPGTARGRSQQPGRFLPHQPLGCRRPAPALVGVRPPLSPGAQRRSRLPPLRHTR